MFTLDRHGPRLSRERSTSGADSDGTSRGTRSSRPLRSLIGLAAVLALLVAACAPDDSAETPDEPTQTDEADEAAPADEATEADETTDDTASGASQAELLRLAIPTDEGTLTPYTYVTGTGWLFLHMVYDSLLALDQQNEPQPLLATDWTVSDDGLTHTLPLRDDVVWHDGEPFTADDVVFSFEFAAANDHSRWTPAVERVVDIEAVNDHEVAITLEQPDGTFQIRPLADMPIFPRHVWEGHGDPEGAPLEDAVGTGPYQLVDYTTEQRYRMEANPDYFLGAPTVDAIEFAVIPERATAFSALRAGEIDVAFHSLEPQLVEQFEQQDDVAIAQGAGFRSELLQFNVEHPPLDQPAVRQAIGYAIDVDELVDVVLLGFGTPGTQGFAHPDSPLAVDPIPHVHDPDRARSLLDEAGLQEDADGRRTFEGEPVTLSLIADAADPIRIRSAEIVSEMLDAVGITVTVEPMERTSVTDRVWPEFDVSQGRDFQLAMFGWSPPVMLDPFRLGSLVHSDFSRGSINIGGLRSDELDALVDEFDAETDPDRRNELMQAIQEGIAEERPFVTLFYADLIFAYRPDVYDQWVFQDGQGIIQKLSFIP